MASQGAQSAFKRYLQSETGPKTVHFWAPVMKWGLVIAGINDLNRPVTALSGTQQMALFATGAIWTRWCLIIKPKNYLLASVNFFLGTVALVQLTRIYKFQSNLGYSPSENLKSILSGQKAGQDKLLLEQSAIQRGSIAAAGGAVEKDT